MSCEENAGQGELYVTPMNLPDQEFEAHFRLSKEVFQAISQELRPYMSQRRRITGVPLKLKICDMELNILYADASFGGAAHDSFVWNQYPIKEYMEELHNNGEHCWLLAEAVKLAALQDAARVPSLAPRATRNAATLTDVCNNDNIPEVEIFSLLQEHIPKYRLRADSLTQFGGYENQDWFIPSPALKLGPQDLGLTPDQIRETLNYFLLCSNRVSQMTKTYNDIEAVTRLLEEKEKDLELTARIGKELLEANTRLTARVTSLEGELKTARDLNTQLRHDLHAKSDLLQVLTNDTEDGGEGEQESAGAVALRKRTVALENENRSLRDEASRLAAGADSAEQAEKRLLRDIAHQLASANSESVALETELLHERERANELQHLFDSTTSRLNTTERALQQLQIEHEQAIRILEITKENQNALAAELADAKERYAEVLSHLSEAQDQLRALRRRGEAARGLMPHVATAAGLLGHTLHAEMQSSVYSDLSLDSGIADQSSMQKVFDTVQCASRWSGDSLSCSDPRPRKPLSTDSFMDDVSDAGSDDMYPGGTGGSGVPGAPGAAELAAALRRLTPDEIDSRRATLAASHRAPYRPVRDLSEESAVWGAGGARWRSPHKLQIVKPMEGSLTLHTWAQLAKPTMSRVLEEQEGIGMRGVRSTAAPGLRLYRLSDVEEDDDMPRLPHSSHVYTFVNSTVLHPNDGSMSGSVCSSALSSLSSSVLGSAWSSRLTSAVPSPTRTPALSRRDSFSTASSLARARYSPTATPANSPLLGSPDSSPPPTPEPYSVRSLLASGTSLLRGESSTIQTPGSLYTGMTHRSPMEQLTFLKRTLKSPAASEDKTSTINEQQPLGQPATPGSGALEGGKRRVARTARPRTDLGTVGSSTPAPAPVHSSPLGTLSSLLFGRKGGLL